MDMGGETAVAADGQVVPAYKLREAEQRIRELERALGRKTMEVEILQLAQAEVKKDRVTTACPSRERASGNGDLSNPGDEPEYGVPFPGAAWTALPAPGR